jgi:hypothetical protein
VHFSEVELSYGKIATLRDGPLEVIDARLRLILRHWLNFAGCRRCVVEFVIDCSQRRRAQSDARFPPFRYVHALL